MNEKEEKKYAVSEIYQKGIENFKKMGVEWKYPGGKPGPSVRANRRYLDTLFFEPRLFDPVDVDTGLMIFGIELRTPIFCSAISRRPYMPEDSLGEIAKGIARAGSLLMLGIGGSSELQQAIHTGAPVVKIVKPYRNMDIIYRKVQDAEKRGCVAVGMDIDHCYGLLLDGKVRKTKLFAPQDSEELKQLISQTKLPFIFKGVLSISDAEKAFELGASAILVSNHGSGAFDDTIPSMIALSEIVERVGEKLTVLVDTGFEKGSDIFKGLACGAKGVGLASPVILAYSADGAKGVELLVNLITEELGRIMSAAGCSALSRIQSSMIRQV